MLVVFKESNVRDYVGGGGRGDGTLSKLFTNKYKLDLINAT